VGTDGAGAVAAAVLGGILVGGGQAGAVTVPAGTITTVAGGVGGPAKATTVAVSPCGARFAGGSLYAGDITAIRKISPASDQLTTPVGTGSTTPLGDGGPATKASLNGSCTAVLDHAGNLVVADTFDNRIRVVAAATGTFYGKHMTAGHIYTVAGNGTDGFSGTGGPATSAELNEPQGVTVDGAGNLMIADTNNNRIRVVARRSGTFYGRHMTAGDIYTVAGTGTAGFFGDGGPATRAKLFDPSGVAVDSSGNLVIADLLNFRVRVVAETTGTFGFSGDGGPAAHAALGYPDAVAADGANLVFADQNTSRIRQVTG
jgi:NHL repeat